METKEKVALGITVTTLSVLGVYINLQTSKPDGHKTPADTSYELFATKSYSAKPLSAAADTQYGRLALVVERDGKSFLCYTDLVSKDKALRSKALLDAEIADNDSELVKITANMGKDTNGNATCDLKGLEVSGYKFDF